MRLVDLISVEMLQKVQDNFSAAVGVAVTIVDERGEPVTRSGGFSAFCKAIRSTEARRERCIHCDNEGGRMAGVAGEPSIYRCHCGLVDFAAPIIVRDQYLGAVISGQVRLLDGQEASLDYIIPPDASWQQDAQLRALNEEIPRIPYQKLRSAAYTLFYLAEYLVEESYSNVVGQQLAAQSLALMEESKRRADLEKSLREAELKALSYQVNPHFMFNVLNTIGRLALKENAQKTENIVYAFADMMRYVLKRSQSQIVELDSEVEHVRNYLFIQKVRMGDRLTFSLDVPGKYAKVLSPFLALHTIVENSINYAVEPREADGRVDVSAHDDGQDLILEVVDNGDGMGSEQILSALRGSSGHHGRASIGLHNVHSRLRYLFGDSYGLVIESPVTQGRGTRVRMRIPLDFDPCERVMSLSKGAICTT